MIDSVKDCVKHSKIFHSLCWHFTERILFQKLINVGFQFLDSFIVAIESVFNSLPQNLFSFPGCDMWVRAFGDVFRVWHFDVWRWVGSANTFVKSWALTGILCRRQTMNESQSLLLTAAGLKVQNMVCFRMQTVEYGFSHKRVLLYSQFDFVNRYCVIICW